MENENKAASENKTENENKEAESSFLSGINKLFNILLPGILMFFAFNDGYVMRGDLGDQILNFLEKDDRYVVSVKQSTNPDYRGITYAEAFGKFFFLPTWKCVSSNEHGVKSYFVEFTGRCSYHDVDVKAKIRFSINKDGKRFKAESLAFNDVLQDKIILAAVIDKAFSEYRKER